MNTQVVVDAIANKQYLAAEEALSEVLKQKMSDALVAKKEEVSQDFGSQLGEAKHDKDYEEFFAKAMKKFGISSPADLKTDEKKKEFFDYVDKNFKSDVEKATGKEDPDADDEEKVARDKAKNEEVELDEKEHTGKSMGMDKVKSKVKAMSSDDQEYLLKLLKGVKKLPKSQLPEEAVGGVGTPAGAATPSATAPTASLFPGIGRPRTPSPGSKEGKRPNRGTDVGGAIIDAVLDGLGVPENKRRPIIDRFIGDLINSAIPGLGIIRTIENIIDFVENLPGGAGGEG